MEKVIQAQRGNEGAFRQLIMERQNTLYRTAYAYAHNQHDALDIVQECVYKAYLSIHKLKEPAHFNTWLIRVLINCAIDYMKKKNRVTLLPNPVSEYVEIPVNSSSVEERMDIAKAVGHLEEKYHTVIILKYYHDLTVFQIAELLSCPVGTVKTRLHTAMKKLRIELKEE